MGATASQRMLKRAWYFHEQRGLCCLQETQACKVRGGRMQLTKPNTRDYASFEHLVPRCVIGKHKPKAHVVLLACRACNTAKGSRVADERMIEIAALYHAAYEKFARSMECGIAEAREPRKQEFVKQVRASTPASRTEYIAAGVVKPKGRAA